MARINSKIDGTDILGVVSAGETLYMARATHTQFGIVKPSIKDFVFDKDSAELLVRLGIGLKHTDDGIALAIYDGNYVTDIESTGDGLLIKYTDIDDGTLSEKTIPWEELNEAQFNELKDYILNHDAVELDFPNGDFTSVQYDTVDGIKLEGSAKVKNKDNTESAVDVSFDIPLIPADDTVSIDRAEVAETKKVLIKATKGIKSISKTANGGLECTLSDNTELQVGPFVTITQELGNSETQVISQKGVTDALAKKPDGGIGVEIGVGSPSSTMQGTLTQTQLETLQANEDNYVMFQHEKYYLNDKGHTEGYLTYTHTGYENNTYWIKSITITISTLAWVLNKGGFAGNGLEFDSTDKLQAKLGTGLFFGTDGSINASATDNPYANTSEEEPGLTGLSASTTLDDIVSLVRSNRTKVLWNELGSSPNGTQLIRLFNLPEGVFSGTYNKIYFKMAADTTYNPPNQVVIDVYLTTEDAYTNVGCYKGVLFSRVAGAAKWTGWVRVTNVVERPVPLYVGEYTTGADAYYSVISFDSHNNDLIFRANYGGIDVKLSELARKSEIPSGGTYYRHLIRLYNVSTFAESNNVVYFELISTSMVAIDSLTDLYTYAKGSHSATGFIGSTGTTYGPVVSIQVTTNAGRVYYAEATSNFSRQLYDTLAAYGLTNVADIVANL
nr:MAG TPA: FIBRITIN, FIBER PROTEIN, CHIMERA, FIBER PROTEIN.9A [Caudoviricetes sp.]